MATCCGVVDEWGGVNADASDMAGAYGVVTPLWCNVVKNWGLLWNIASLKKRNYRQKFVCL